MILKYLLLLAIVVLAFYWWRHNRRSGDAPPAAKPPSKPSSPSSPSSGPDAMVVCQHCGVHLPSRESVRGSLGAYCSTDHRRLSEGQ
jgi:uncharacterized protein